MTRISEQDMPAIDVGEPEKVVAERPSNAKMVGVVAGSALLITFVNLAATIYLYRGIDELRAVEARLQQLAAFEQRITARIETVNNGFQSRFEKLDGQLQGRFNEINGGIARLEQAGPAAGGGSVSSVVEPPAIAADARAPAIGEGEGESAGDAGSVDESRPTKKRVASAAPPPPNSSYQRIEQPDGKVYYRKIN